MEAVGKKTWVIPDMYWPEITSPGHYVSHESVCVMNTSEKDCEVTISLYFEDRPPIEGLKAVCPAKRTNHIRMDAISSKNRKVVPRGVPYAALVRCSIPAVVQYTRVDTTQGENSLMTTIGYPV